MFVKYEEKLRRFGLGLVVVLGCVAVPAALAASKPLPLSARVIQQGEFPPFLAFPGQSTRLYKTPAKWVALNTSLSRTTAAAEAARMHREGFVALLSRQLGTRTKVSFGGLSWVMQLRSAAAARAELAANVRDAKGTTKTPFTYAPFAVTAIPNAHGYHLGGGGGSGDNVVFADGPFVYLVGVGSSGKTSSGPTRAQLIAAATRLYTRVRGHPPA